MGLQTKYRRQQTRSSPIDERYATTTHGKAGVHGPSLTHPWRPCSSAGLEDVQMSDANHVKILVR